jgi:lipopolysaccharide transport system ATP-binding protein
LAGSGVCDGDALRIPLMDEWSLAGDAQFMERAKPSLEAMVEGANILMLSTHNAEILRAWRNRCIVARPGPHPRRLATRLGAWRVFWAHDVRAVLAEAALRGG